MSIACDVQTYQLNCCIECSDRSFAEPQPPKDLPAAVQPQVGEQWEEFLRYALDLQRRIAQGVHGCLVFKAACAVQMIA